MQQMLDATLVNAADDAPANAPRLNPELEDIVYSPVIQSLPIAKTGASESAFHGLSDVISLSDNPVVATGSAKLRFFQLLWTATV